MSNELPQDFNCLVLFAALSGRIFSKSELGIKMSVAEIKRLIDETNLITATPKGRSLDLAANEETFRWSDHHLNDDLPGNNKAVRAVLNLVRAKTAAFLKANQISFNDFVATASIPLAPANPLDSIRHAYLKLSNGSYKVRVLLKDLRPHLPFGRETQDSAFFEMIRSGEADFYPEDDPMSRNEDDDRSALQIADRQRHVMYLHPEPRA